MYDIRIVAYVGRMDLSDDRDANDDLSSAAFGMQIGFRFVEDGETITGSKKYYCRYVYEEILEDYGSGTVSAESYESRYLVVFHVEGCDASKAVEFDVTTFAEFEDEYGARTTEWSEESMTFSIRF